MTFIQIQDIIYDYHRPYHVDSKKYAIHTLILTDFSFFFLRLVQWLGGC
jgi:hypothetical protein